jgi:hypothetical protein
MNYKPGVGLWNQGGGYEYSYEVRLYSGASPEVATCLVLDPAIARLQGRFYPGDRLFLQVEIWLKQIRWLSSEI